MTIEFDSNQPNVEANCDIVNVYDARMIPDFVGHPMNCGARLQSLAGPYGVVLDSKGAEVAINNKNRVLRESNSCEWIVAGRSHQKSITKSTFS